MKRILVMLLTALLLASTTACGEKTSGETTDDKSAAISSESATETESETTPLASLQKMDHGGYAFRMLGDTNSNWWIISLNADEETGEIINDTVFQRKTFVEDLYNVKISLEETTTASAQIQKSVQAGSDEYDQVWERINTCLPMAEAGQLLDLHSVDALSFDPRWWDKNSIDAFTFNGRIFFACNDTNVHTIEGCSAMFFSKTMAEQNNLENPYSLVREQKWTLDKMGEMMKAVAADTNGDGKRNDGDTFGLVTGIGQYLSLVDGAGTQLVYLDENADETRFVLNTASADVIDITAKVAALLNDKSLTVIVNNDEWGRTSFYTDMALFYIMQLGTIADLRDNMENPFGVLPFPMRDEAQDYYTCCMEATAQAMCIPQTAAANRDVIGDVIEAMAIYSDAYLTNAYYDTTLKGKIARDEDTTEMLDLLTANRTFDYATCYGSWQVYNQYLSSVQKNGAEQLASMTEKIQDKFNEKAAAAGEALRNVQN